MTKQTVIDTTIGELVKLKGKWEGTGFNVLTVPGPSVEPQN
jgi:hypothetical protein